MRTITTFLREEQGLTTVEYAIGGTLVGITVVVAFTQLGDAVGNAIDSITNAADPPPPLPLLAGQRGNGPKSGKTSLKINSYRIL